MSEESIIAALQAELAQERTKTAGLQARLEQAEEAEAASAAQAARLREQAGLLDLTHDGIFVRAVDGTIRYWNRGAELLYGWAASEAVGCKTYELLQTVFPVSFEHALARLLRDGHWEGELVHTRRDKTKIIVESRWALEMDERGEPAAVLEINTDITETKRAENELRASRERLQAFSRLLVDAIENERRTIARELHDEAGQTLTTLKIGMGMLQKGGGIPQAAIDRLEELKQLVDRITDDLRKLALNLRPGALDRLGLVPAIEQYTEGFAQQTGLRIRFEPLDTGSERLPTEVETSLYRIVQEALTNVARHAQASQVDILLQRGDDEARLVIEDDGVGFDLEQAARKGHLGLVGIRERAEMLGGTLTVESAAGQGTALFVTVPTRNLAVAVGA